MTKELPLVSIVTVNYNQTSLSLKFLDSINKISYPHTEIFVVDNGSERPIVLDKNYENVHLIYSKANLGFAGGNNLALKQCKGDYILLINNDTEVDSDFLEPLVNLLAENENIGMVSPKIIYYGSDRILQYAGYTEISPFTGRNRTIGQFEKDNGQHDEIKKTDYAHGAAMLIKREILNTVGYMPEEFFLYYEELDWCEQIKRAGYEIFYHPGSVVYHKESMSVGQESPLKIHYIFRNRFLFMKRNFSGFKLFAFITYYMLIAIPKNIVKYLLINDIKAVKAIAKGLIWNFKN